MANKDNTTPSSGITSKDIQYLQSLHYIADPEGRDVLVCKDEHASPVRINGILKAAKLPGADNAAQYEMREDHVKITGRHPVSYIEHLGVRISKPPVDARERLSRQHKGADTLSPFRV